MAALTCPSSTAARITAQATAWEHSRILRSSGYTAACSRSAIPCADAPAPANNIPTNRSRRIARIRNRSGVGDNRWALILLLVRAVSEALFEAATKNSDVASADGRNDDGEGA